MSLAKKKYKKKLKNHYYHEGYKSLNYDNVYKSLYNNPVHTIPRPKIKEADKKSNHYKSYYNAQQNKVDEIKKNVYSDLYIPQCVYNKKKRVVAIGDIHGDWRALVYCLLAANVIDNNGKWIGKNTYVVQLGDCTDRYRAIENSNGELTTKTDEKSEKRILKYLWKLDKEAIKKKGRVLTLIGNHEIMNTKGQLSYVTPLGRSNFKNTDANLPFSLNRFTNNINTQALENRYNLNNFNENLNMYNNYGYGTTRKAMWKPGSVYSKLYSNYPAILKIGDLLFMHGGLRLDLARKYMGNNGIKRMNMYMWAYLNKKLSTDDMEEFMNIFGNHKDPNKKGVIWYKSYSRAIQGKQPLCDDLKKTLKLMKCKKMIVAHVPQKDGISHDCDKHIIKTNVGMSEAFGRRFKKKGRIPQVLEITNGNKYRIILSKNEINNAIKAGKPYNIDNSDLVVNIH